MKLMKGMIMNNGSYSLMHSHNDETRWWFVHPMMNMYVMVYSRWNSDDDDYVSTVHSSIFVYWCMSGESILYNSIFVQQVWSWMMSMHAILMQILRGWCILHDTTV